MYKKPIRGPLSADSNRFFRGYKMTPKLLLPPVWIRSILSTLYIFFLMAIDLLLFADSGNLSVFHGLSMLPELKLLLVLLFVFSTLLIGLSSFSKIAQNLICAGITLLFMQALLHQFAVFDSEAFLNGILFSFLGGVNSQTFLGTSSFIFSFVLGILVFIFLTKASMKWIGVYVFMVFVTFAGILHNSYVHTRKIHDFIEISEAKISLKKELKNGQRFIHIMLPNLASYKYFGLTKTLEGAETQNIITGFLARNGFEVYENAFNKYNDAPTNMVDILNLFSRQKPEQHMLREMLLYHYWKFFNINDEYVFLKDNQLFDTFKKAGYKLTAYKSQGTDICYKNNSLNVDRCIEKINRPANLYSLALSTRERAQILGIEWLTSMNLINNMSPVFKFLKIFSRPENLPMIGISYNNLYVLNSIKTFDILAENVLQDKGRNAYFIYADIPSDMFIYDQFCTIKPRNEWINLNNLPWIEIDKTDFKRHAYSEQTRCLYGKLQEFLDRLNEVGLLDKTVIVLEGVSSNNDFSTRARENFVEDMLYNKLVMFAIKAPDIKKTMINKQMCTAKSILRHFLYSGAPCTKTDELSLHENLMKELENKFNSLSLPVSFEQNTAEFESWYKYWQIVNKIVSDNNSSVMERRKTNVPQVLENEENMPDLMQKNLKAE